MKGRSLSILGIIAGVIAAALILGHKLINSANVTMTAGLIFMAVGVLNLILNSATARTGNSLTRVFTLIANSASIVLGLSMLIFRSTFSPLIAFIFSLLVAIAALWQFFVLAVGTRPHQLPAWLYLFPVALAAGAVYMFMFLPKGNDAYLMLSTGISMAVLAAGCIIEGSCLGVARRSYEKARAEAELAAAQHADVTIEHLPDKPADQAPAIPHPQTTEDLDDVIKDSNYE